MSELVALVTGAASGIGRAVANKLARRGISLLLADRNQNQGSAAADDIAQKYRVRAKFQRVDVTQESEVKQLVAAALEFTGRLDYAANCAGICETVWDEEESITTELFDRTHAVNTRGLWLCQKYEALQMRSQQPRNVTFDPPSPVPIPGQRGSIANVVSISGLHAIGLAAYTPSKYGAAAVTKNGAKFYGPSGIRVNAVCPGWTMTAMIAESMGEEGKIGTKENDNSPVNQKIGLRLI
ncbi:2,5-dichloro-2,5-cyclohexadiene-1,4-diol dehydrogenase [Fonsecaea erecta]|uniref:2,5-dichloro-2,5-cyclohexadiene-1,4-diol dehydrogenase n=1 Tax=Fonsecaea erecta TaxID=1367422 RepID=A0A178ZFI5_9EURO|nr:2,5-dichloro-2,5-cyclohexadiene-1,4-diol dehydrogenase [Fonsecaea erecta]OAP58402.1 2,5-dichloro-2,5-cyclohexadiene-1,4-diol dehydrogenase [Fonsecaea erecta]